MLRLHGLPLTVHQIWMPPLSLALALHAAMYAVVCLCYDPDRDLIGRLRTASPFFDAIDHTALFNRDSGYCPFDRLSVS